MLLRSHPIHCLVEGKFCTDTAGADEGKMIQEWSRCQWWPHKPRFLALSFAQLFTREKARLIWLRWSKISCCSRMKILSHNNKQHQSIMMHKKTILHDQGMIYWLRCLEFKMLFVFFYCQKYINWTVDHFIFMLNISPSVFLQWVFKNSMVSQVIFPVLFLFVKLGI